MGHSHGPVDVGPDRNALAFGSSGDTLAPVSDPASWKFSVSPSASGTTATSTWCTRDNWQLTNPTPPAAIRHDTAVTTARANTACWRQLSPMPFS